MHGPFTVVPIPFVTMSTSDSIEVPVHPTDARFTTTLWTEVLAAPRDEKALASLCRKYWYPLYAFLRRNGVSSHDSEDLTQGFFVHLLSRQSLETVRREYGRFRSFLLVSLQHFVADQRDRTFAAKRSPRQPLFELDARTAEDRYRLEPVERMTPETIFERRWALTMLEEALAALESEFMTSGRGEIFRELQPFHGGCDSRPTSPALSYPRTGTGITCRVPPGPHKTFPQNCSRPDRIPTSFVACLTDELPR